MQFPSPCPQIEVANLPAALAWYRDRLGFAVDWSDAEIGLAGLSRGAARVFLASNGAHGPMTLWINLSNRAEIDALHAEWAAAGVAIAAPPTAQPYKLYEFYAEDPDGNCFRVFYDFAWEEREGVNPAA